MQKRDRIIKNTVKRGKLQHVPAVFSNSLPRMYEDGALRTRYWALKKVGFNDQLVAAMISNMRDDRKTFIEIPSNKPESHKRRNASSGPGESQAKRSKKSQE